MGSENSILLAVDDNPENLFVIEQLVRERMPGCELLTAKNAIEGFSLLESRPVDGVLVDVQMPGMDGIEMCRRMKGNALTARIPVILITSHQADPELKARGLEGGADDFLSRPIDNTEFVAKIRVMLRIKRVEDELRWVNEHLEELVDRKVRALRESEGKARDLMREAEETRLQMAMIVESSNDAIFGLDPDGKVFAWNLGAEKTYGYSAEEIVGRSVSCLIPPALAHEMEKYLEEAASGGVPVNHATRHLKSDGTEFDVSLTVSSIRDKEGKVMGVSTIARDITRRKEAERALLESEQRYSSMFEDNYAVMTLLDPDTGEIVDANPAACLYYGYEKAELLSKKNPDLCALPPEEMLRNVELARSEKSNHLQSRHRLANGEVRDVEIYSGPIRVYDRDLLFNIIHDVTDRKRAEEARGRLEIQLRRAQRMEAIGTLAGGIAHDFNNILSAILGYAEIVREDVGEQVELRENVDEILRATNRAADLVKQILTFSRQSEQECKPVQLHLIVREAMKLLRATLPSTIEIREDIDRSCGTVLADPTQMHQVVMNLCSNASHAMRNSSGVLTISLQSEKIDDALWKEHTDLHEGPYIHLKISDTGQGMGEETRERIFDPFFTTKGPGEGTGMGLSTVHGIVMGHHGHISVASEPGRGSTFSVYLPRFGSVEPVESETVGPLPGGEEHVLFVDDEKALVKLGRQILGRLGYKATALTSSLEALGKFRERPDDFDVVVTDLTMPHLTGVELAREILRIRPNTPIILCTGYSEKVLEPDVRKMGFRQLVMKPIIMHNLAEALRKALEEESVEIRK